VLLAVFAGGAIGAVARAELAVAWAHAPASWPWATFAVNITGALLLGYVATALRERQAAFWGAGVCGALTTFSTMQLEAPADAGPVAPGPRRGVRERKHRPGTCGSPRRTADRGRASVSAAVVAGIAVLGGVGAVARVLLAAGVAARRPVVFPLGILVVNITGAFALGALAASGASGDLQRLLGTGFLGAYTTFSTWMVDSDRLPRRVAAANLVVSIALGVAAVYAGRSLA